MRPILISLYSQIFSMWNYFWYLYHYAHLKKHDSRLDAVVPDWIKTTDPNDD